MILLSTTRTVSSSFLLFIIIFGGASVLASATQNDMQRQQQQQIDASWPTHYQYFGSRMTDGDRSREYRNFLKGCTEQYSSAICTKNEEERLELNLSQPRYMTNYTSAGYAKVRTPTKSYQILSKFWNENNHPSSTMLRTKEDWSDGDTNVNHWESPTDVVLIDGPSSSTNTKRMTSSERRIVADEVRSVMEKWSGTSLITTSLYGVRVYREGAILAPHVDRLPLVISAIINVAQDDNDEPWPLEVIDHDGIAHNITMEPGDMVLYEGASIIHGRPFPLQGSYYANVFIHAEPIGYTEAIERKMKTIVGERKEQKKAKKTDKELFDAALAKQQQMMLESKTNGNNNADDDAKGKTLPSYIEEDSIEAQRWRQEYTFYRREKVATDNSKQKQRANANNAKARGVTSAHVHAATGNLAKLKDAYKQDAGSIDRSDSNGWKPIHEAARGGKTHIVEYLIKQGVDVNERTNNGKGANALWWAKQQLPENHPTIKLLQEHGAAAIGPHE